MMTITIAAGRALNATEWQMVRDLAHHMSKNGEGVKVEIIIPALEQIESPVN